MTKRTKKVGITGKFGTRYGSSLRKIIKKFEHKQRAKYCCPRCGKTAIKRTAVGIWRCKSCMTTFAGGAWELSTTLAVTAKTTMNRLRRLREEAAEAQNKEVQPKEAKRAKKEKK
ncbi:60S ribosomal protein L37a-like [Hippocampus zosterae]|uniref:60S ribosomal protein L37a-like n=1 Tax=Hippocampus zosterae TaxID=109293 RepID=UPI00223C9A7F|nr:60S ribosomal protein L37a-like [Hippocampus zosterae]